MESQLELVKDKIREDGMGIPVLHQSLRNSASLVFTLFGSLEILPVPILHSLAP
jgi:hypothetical protein